MTLLHWFAQTPTLHLLGECFDVQSDLEGATELLGERAHLLPMSDSTLLQVATGIAMNGEMAFVEWPTRDTTAVTTWIQQLIEADIIDRLGAVVLRIHLSENAVLPNVPSHPKVQAWGIRSAEDRLQRVQTALRQSGIHLFFESAAAIAFHTLDSQYLLPESTPNSSIFGATPAHCVILTQDAQIASVSETLDILSQSHPEIAVQTVVQQQLAHLDPSSIEAVQATGRVLAVGLPSEWMHVLIQQTFWTLESEPVFLPNTSRLIAEILRSLED